MKQESTETSRSYSHTDWRLAISGIGGGLPFGAALGAFTVYSWSGPVGSARFNMHLLIYWLPFLFVLLGKRIPDATRKTACGSGILGAAIGAGLACHASWASLEYRSHPADPIVIGIVGIVVLVYGIAVLRRDTLR